MASKSVSIVSAAFEAFRLVAVERVQNWADLLKYGRLSVRAKYVSFETAAAPRWKCRVSRYKVLELAYVEGLRPG